MRYIKIRLKTLFILSAVMALLYLCAGSIGILNAAPGKITVLSPNGGEVLKAGSKIDIKWRYSGLAANAKVVIVLYKKGLKHSIIARQAPNSGRFSWKLPGRLPQGKDYRVRIRAKKNLSVNDFSDRNFTIKK